ncbi:LacI family DNA-binding transcriptional regulator [Cellulomonas sp. SLBN-39]|uniref:LacI family DNA-binding transcriptional regulator n=1 Tax=Cellulomonas sp. SLBN-39 TaxID=2768446 RepID=UPI001151914E|nr:LacI family DNA-binding transcriptional regulator [Cellulomonas sp. SLBN-39]TQL02319.1 LacI family transcriptional regulator [Cellulomonas sp. SLBN-39]
MRAGGVPTLKDVAAAAGVSVMTASNAVNGRPRVAPATRQRVLDAVEALGYEVNLTARRLRAGRSGTIALAVPRLDHPYFGDLAARFATALAPGGRHLVLEQTGASKEGELTALSQARLQMYDGVLLSVVGLQHADVERLQGDLPLVLLGERPMPARFDHVMLGNVEGARLATAHLLARGARRVAVVGGAFDEEPGVSSTRTQGWREAHEAAGVPVDERLVLPAPALEMAQGRAAVDRALAEGLALDAVFAVTDQVAMGALAALHSHGRSVPGDVQVVGFDALSLGEHLWPALTTVDPRHDLLVEHALRLLDRRASGDRADPEHLVLPVRLLERASTR